MPTVHLSLPEGVYRELKRFSSHMGIQITDLIKMLINNGLEELREKYGIEREEEIISAINALIETMNRVERKLTYLELRVRENEIKLREFIDNVNSRLNDLELSIQEIQEPVLEPELIKARTRKHRI